MRHVRKILGIAAVVVVVVLALGAAVAFAYPAAQDGDDPAASAGGNGPCEVSREVMAQIIDPEAMKATLAGALGLTVEELEAARAEGQGLVEIAEAQGVERAEVQATMEAARAEAIQEAAGEGLISDEQAECLLGLEWPQRRDHFGGGLLREIIDPEAMQAALAEALGLTVEELEAARAEGKTVADIAEEQGVEPAEVREAMQAAWAAAVEQAEEDGLITPEQAERLLNHGGWRLRRGLRGGPGFQGGRFNGVFNGGPAGLSA
ncbi:MAG: hypothetical protein L0332_33590 [Chloroflexi bacterium]|nr:hypothetical protein [Chloroflexota bacterium]MCI0580521.1 hypothetical protein [Chloroflexota bacterium]MCI0648128.1 hypothetical protein [Chloroflexota bacterium]MCI0731636.1 hypothetical protein [Chloroflexota bacterium]